VFFGAFDPNESLVALEHGGYEYFELALVAGARNAPRILPRKTLRITINDGITIGSRRATIERFFGYPSGAKSVKKCGLVAERFGTLGQGAALSYSFIFRDDRVVALDYWFGS
jgi:hypothetical protein